MFDIGGGELLLIVFVVLLLFGPKKIPEIARTLGKGMSHLRRAQAEFQRNINEVSTDVERTAGLKDDPRPFRPKPQTSLPSPSDTPVVLGSTEVNSTSKENPVENPTSQPQVVIRPAEGALARQTPIEPLNSADTQPENR